MRVCWNWQTGTFEVRVLYDVRVQVPSLAPCCGRQKDVSHEKARLYRAFLLPKRRFFSVQKHRCKIAVFPLWQDSNSRKMNTQYTGRQKSKIYLPFLLPSKRRKQICSARVRLTAAISSVCAGQQIGACAAKKRAATRCSAHTITRYKGKRDDGNAVSAAR